MFNLYSLLNDQLSIADVSCIQLEVKINQYLFLLTIQIIEEGLFAYGKFAHEKEKKNITNLTFQTVGEMSVSELSEGR